MSPEKGPFQKGKASLPAPAFFKGYVLVFGGVIPSYTYLHLGISRSYSCDYTVIDHIIRWVPILYCPRHPVIPTEVWCFRYDFGVLFNTLPQFRYDWMSFWGCSSPSKHPHATLRSLAGFVRNPFWTLARRCSIKSCKATSVDGSNHVQSKWPTQPPIQSWGRCWENPWDAGPLIINTMYVYIHLIDYIVCICWV